MFPSLMGSKVNFCDRNCELNRKDTNADDGYARTAPVGSYLAGASPCGALDMAGHVWEWVADWYDHGCYASSPARNPKGPDSGNSRVLRGGSCYSHWFSTHAADGHRDNPSYRYSRVGFRCGAAAPGG